MEIGSLEKLRNNDTVVPNADVKAKRRSNEKNESGLAGVENGSINASGLNLNQDNILARKQQAQKQAMGILKKQFAADGELDRVIEKGNKNVEKGKEEAQEAQQEINKIDQSIEPLGEAYGGEQDVSKAMYEKQRDEALNSAYESSKMMGEIIQDRLKDRGMLDSVELKEEMEEDANQEMIGMLVAEGMDYLDEKQQEAMEKTEAAAKEKEEKEKEKLLAKQKEKKQETDKFDKSQEVEKVQNDSSKVPDWEKTIKSVGTLRDKMKLTREDLKGIEIDASVDMFS